MRQNKAHLYACLSKTRWNLPVVSCARSSPRRRRAPRVSRSVHPAKSSSLASMPSCMASRLSPLLQLFAAMRAYPACPWSNWRFVCLTLAWISSGTSQCCHGSCVRMTTITLHSMLSCSKRSRPSSAAHTHLTTADTLRRWRFYTFTCTWRRIKGLGNRLSSAPRCPSAQVSAAVRRCLHAWQRFSCTRTSICPCQICTSPCLLHTQR